MNTKPATDPAKDMHNNSAQSNPMLGAFFMCCFTAIAPIMDTIAKFLSNDVSAGELVFLRFTMQAGFLGFFMIAMSGFGFKFWHKPSKREIALQFLRGGFVAIAVTLIYYAVKFMPVADAIAIFFVEPLLVTLLGALLFKERIGWRRILACAIGFFGALLIIRPSFASVGWPALLPLGTALSYALYFLLTNKMSPDGHPVAIQCYTGLAAALIALPALLIGNQMGLDMFAITDPRPYWKLILLLGIIATVSHLFIPFALRYADASQIAPLQYLEIISATVLGVIVFHDIPDKISMVGIAIIMASGVFVMKREQKLQDDLEFERSPAQALVPAQSDLTIETDRPA